MEGDFRKVYFLVMPYHCIVVIFFLGLNSICPTGNNSVEWVGGVDSNVHDITIWVPQRAYELYEITPLNETIDSCLYRLAMWLVGWKQAFFEFDESSFLAHVHKTKHAFCLNQMKILKSNLGVPRLKLSERYVSWLPC